MLRSYFVGLEAKTPQVVGNMCIIPLVAQGENHKVGSVRDLYLKRDTSYDSLEVGTNAANPTIIPNGYTIITKERAQDRTVPGKALVAGGKSKVVNAFCVQSSQSGYMSSGNHDVQKFRLLPASLRLQAYRDRGVKNLRQLWDTLGAYNRQLGVQGDYLTHFFEKYKQQLEEFVAEFEIIDGQRGAIICINNEMVGVEISPNPKLWADQWETLIRDCYGAEAIVQQAKTQVVDDSQIFGDVTTLEDLLTKLDSIEEAEFAFAERLVNDVLDQTETAKEVQRESGFVVLDVETPQFVGQAVKDTQDRLIDVTLLRRDAAQRGFRMARR